MEDGNKEQLDYADSKVDNSSNENINSIKLTNIENQSYIQQMTTDISESYKCNETEQINIHNIQKQEETAQKDDFQSENQNTEPNTMMQKDIGVSQSLKGTDKSENMSNVDRTETGSQYDPKNVHYEGDIAIYTDQISGYQYQWDKLQEKWIPRENIVYGFEDDTHTYTDTDGMKFFWDKEKNAWFPKINDDFMAQYQMNYGFVDNTSTKEALPEEEIKIVKQPEPKGVKRKPNEPSWFEIDEERNTKVYVSNLPTDINEEEFVELMQKYGLVMRDPITQKMKVKLYKDADTDFLKGDALCTYIRVESVDLAIKLLDNYTFKGKRIKVERAKFQMRGEYDPKLKPKTKKRKEKDKLKKMQEKLFDWRPEKMIGERAKHERVVIVKNVFDPKVFDEEVGLILEYQQDLREECSKCGDVRKVIVFDRHPEGVIQVNMKEPEEAEAAVTLLNGRWFGKRQLTAEIWDGRTKYKIAETDSEISQRINKWDKFLEGGENIEKTT